MEEGRVSLSQYFLRHKQVHVPSVKHVCLLFMVFTFSEISVIEWLAVQFWN